MAMILKQGLPRLSKKTSESGKIEKYTPRVAPGCGEWIRLCLPSLFTFCFAALGAGEAPFGTQLAGFVILMLGAFLGAFLARLGAGG